MKTDEDFSFGLAIEIEIEQKTKVSERIFKTVLKYIYDPLLYHYK